MNPKKNIVVALVTGASRGIGYAIAKKLSHIGILVIGTTRTPYGKKKLINI